MAEPLIGSNRKLIFPLTKLLRRTKQHCLSLSYKINNSGPEIDSCGTPTDKRLAALDTLLFN